jgi:ketosteroid isomerase-like protein
MIDQKSIVQALYAATGQGDWATAEGYLTEDFFVTEAPHLPMAGCYRGRTAFRALYERVFAMIDVVGLEVHDIAVGDTHAVCILDMLLAGTPPVRVPIAEMFKFRDGKVCEIKPYYYDPALLTRRSV